MSEAAAQPASAPAARRPAALVALACALLAAVAAYCVHLWPEWSSNPDLSHGYFAPLVFLFLVWESRRQGPWRWLPARTWVTALEAGALLLGLSLLVLAGLFAASLGWSHSVVLFLLAIALGVFLAAGLTILADERVQWLPCNWISVTALLLWPLVAPLPQGTYARLTLSLQGWVTDSVMATLQIVGVPARQHGNIIELARTTVGVEEACSGVRSLISCLYAGFFFAAWQVRRPLRRVVLIAVAPLLALGMNFLRSLTLTLLANAGVDITGTWHDATGFAILGVTAAVLAGLAVLLESDDHAAAPAPPPARAPALRLGVFWAGTAAATAVGLFFFLNSRPTSGPRPPEPVAFADLLPNEAPGWQVATPQDLYRFSSILLTEHLAERTYLKQDARGNLVQVTIYVAFWPAGQTSVSQVASHTPDACWPGAGWQSATAGTDRRQPVTAPGLALAPAEYRLFRNERNVAQHVWFWHIFDGRVIDYRDPYSLSALLQIALDYGFTRQGSQYFVRVSSNRPWEEFAGDPFIRGILANLDRVGL
jgi:exosortase